MPDSSLRPKNRGAPRWGQWESTRPGLPLVSRKAMSFSLSRVTRAGGQSAEGIFLREAGGDPVSPEQVAHGCAGAGLGQQVILVSSEHAFLPLRAARAAAVVMWRECTRAGMGVSRMGAAG